MDVTTKISDVQKEVLRFLVIDKLTIKKVALLRKTSVQSVYKIVNKLKKKGLISGNQLGGFKDSQSTSKLRLSLPNSKTYIRLHGISYKIKILDKSKLYLDLISSKNLEYVDNHTIRLHNDCLIVYLNRDFIYADPDKATYESMNFINRFNIKLENRFGLILYRQRYTECKLLSSHYAEVNNEFAEEVNKDNIKFNMYSRSDGKLWATIDFSNNKPEFETLHPETSHPDMNKVKDFFNDIRDNDDVLVPSEMYKMVSEIIKSVHGLTKLQTISQQLQEDNAVTVGKIINKIQEW